MNDAVLSALETRRYRPVKYQGKPISVTYNFNVKLDLPRYQRPAHARRRAQGLQQPVHVRRRCCTGAAETRRLSPRTLT